MPARATIHISVPRDVHQAAIKRAKDDHQPLSKWLRLLLDAELARGAKERKES